MRAIEVPCFVEVEQTAEYLFAQAIPEGVDIGPGDSVLVRGAPTLVRFGDKLRVECTATVIRAGFFGRHWARFSGLLELFELYEVGFQPKET
jgi:hypothetical protein